MAKESIKARDRKKAKLVEKYKAKRAEYKKLAANGDLEAQAKLDLLPRNSSYIRLHNRCRLTGRPKGYMRKFGICRVIFRTMAAEGKIPGVTKASW